MKSLVSGCILLLVFCIQPVLAQDFTGYVKRADTLVSPVYQAKVQVYDDGQLLTEIKTYFNGSYHFPTEKNQVYHLKISYTGYIDTSLKITTDKEAKPDTTNVTVILKKDGMRLLGIIRGAQDTFPISEATIVLKNIMTKQEDRITTDIDGSYNFKLDYETNYHVYIDKYSPGVINKFKDTSFYVSTVGFNLPLDYRLDIYLRKDYVQNTPLPDAVENKHYQAGRQPFQSKKPVAPSTSAVAASPAIETTNAEKPKTEAGHTNVAATGNKKKGKNQKENVEVVVIGESPPPVSKHTANPTPKPAPVEVKIDTTAKPVVVADTLSIKSNNHLKIGEEREARIKAMARQKIVRDSIAHLHAVESANAKKMVNDSIEKAKELSSATPSGKADSVVKVVEVKPAQKQRHENAEKAKLAPKDTVLQVAETDKKPVVEKNGKLTRKERINEKKEEKSDSTRMAIVAQAKKKIAADSMAHAAVVEKQMAEKRAHDDSLAYLAGFNRRKVVGSQEQLKEKEIEIGKEQQAQKRREDSITQAKQKVMPVPATDTTKRSVQAILQEPKKAPEIKKPEINPKLLDTPVTNLPSILFYKNGFDLPPKAEEKLKELAKSLQNGEIKRIHLYGLATADEQGPLYLSKRRLESVQKLLTAEGVTADKIEVSNFGSSFSRSGCNSHTCPDEILRLDRCVVYKAEK